MNNEAFDEGYDAYGPTEEAAFVGLVLCCAEKDRHGRGKVPVH